MRAAPPRLWEPAHSTPGREGQPSTGVLQVSPASTGKDQSERHVPEQPESYVCK